MMLPFSLREGNGYSHLLPEVPNLVIIAFDQLTDDEKRRVIAALQSLERDGLHAPSSDLDLKKLDGPEPLYALRAAPDVQILLRAEAGTPIEVMDIVRPAALRGFAHAG